MILLTDEKLSAMEIREFQEEIPEIKISNYDPHRGGHIIEFPDYIPVEKVKKLL